MNMRSNINELSCEVCNNILKTTISKLSIILTTFGTLYMDDLLYILWNGSCDNSENQVQLGKKELILNYISPIACIIHNDISKNTSTGNVDKLTNDTDLKKQNLPNLECCEILDTNNFIIDVNGIYVTLYNCKLNQSVVIKGVVNQIDIDHLNNIFIQQYVTDYDNYFKNSVEDIKTVSKNMIDFMTLKDILIYNINDQEKLIMSLINQIHVIKRNKIQANIDKFNEYSLSGKRKMIVNMLLYGKDNVVYFIANMLYEIISMNSDDKTPHNELLIDSFTWKMKQLVKDCARSSINYNNDMRKKYDTNDISLEHQIYLLQVNEKVKEKALAKYKEVKSKNDDSNSKAKQYLEALVKIPFNIVKEEKVLTLLKDINRDINQVFSICDNIKILECESKNKKPSYTKYEISTIFNKMSSVYKDVYFEIFKNKLQTLDTKQIDKILTRCNDIFENKVYKNGNKKNKINNIIANVTNNKNIISNIEETYNEYNFINIDTKMNSISNKTLKLNEGIEDIENVLDNCVYGHNSVKKQIFKVIAQWINGEQNGYCFGFEGSPGVGKTSLAKKGISKCLVDDDGNERPFSFIALGGSSNGSYLEGHGYTYMNSNWGKIVDILMESKCMNPIIYIDELDKVSGTEQGKELIGILTHLIDKSQNNCFQDRYFTGIDIDLSKVLFVFSYNDASKIDSILLDRIHRIKFDNLSTEEKIVIAKKYIIPELTTEMNLNDVITINDEVIEYIIENYTNEPGVRKLKELFFDIYGDINIQLLLCKDNLDIPIQLTIDLLDNKYLKKYHKITHMKINTINEIGTINGLWANSYGNGGIIPIQTTFFPSSVFLEYKLTGLQGDVMKESMNVAKTLAWSITNNKIQKKLLKQFETTKQQGIHVHCPDGSISKDGPSAGTAITIALYSLFNSKDLPNTCGITGEITLNGTVTAIGGLYEKITGGIIAGIKTFIVPYDNIRQFEQVNQRYTNKGINIYDKASFHFVKNIQEVLDILKI
jgi:ATP-dependent Lon protease